MTEAKNEQHFVFITDLMQRLIEAKGPDLLLDTLIWAELRNRDVISRPTRGGVELYSVDRRVPHERIWLCWIFTDSGYCNPEDPYPAYTASVDACLIAAAEHLPKHEINARLRVDRSLARITRGSEVHLGDGATLPLALCHAILSTLASYRRGGYG